MTRAFHAVTAEPWAILPDWLHAIAALALRQRDHVAVQAIRTPTQDPREQTGAPSDEEEAMNARRRRELAMMCGEMSQRRLDNGSGRAIVNGNVAVIPVFGPIYPRANMMTDFSGATAISSLRRDAHAAFNDDTVDALLWAIDSPGGAVSGVNGFVDFLHANRGRKPMAAHVLGTGASAAYWIATALERVTLERTAMVGSIGVVAAIPKQVSPDRDGDLFIEIVSSNAPNKRPDPTTPEGVLEIRDSLDAIEKQFVADVARGRKVSAEAVLAEFGKGGVVVGGDATKRGMADAITSMDAAVRHMARVGKQSRAKQAG